MTVQNGLILKGTRIVIPKKMKLNILERLHTGHLGQEKCKRRARATVFWPGINKDIEKMVNQCSEKTPVNRVNVRSKYMDDHGDDVASSL